MAQAKGNGSADELSCQGLDEAGYARDRVDGEPLQVQKVQRNQMNETDEPEPYKRKSGGKLVLDASQCDRPYMSCKAPTNIQSSLTSKRSNFVGFNSV